MASQYHSAIAACTATHSCTNQGGLFLGNRAVGFLVIMTLGAPVLAGLFWGAPLVASELETGTSQFAWMQSVTRRRWLAVKTGWMLLAARPRQRDLRLPGDRRRTGADHRARTAGIGPRVRPPS